MVTKQDNINVVVGMKFKKEVLGGFFPKGNLMVVTDCVEDGSANIRETDADPNGDAIVWFDVNADGTITKVTDGEGRVFKNKTVDGFSYSDELVELFNTCLE